MSAGRVFQEVLRRLSRIDLPDVARTDVLQALEMGRSGPHQFFYDAALEAGLPRDVALPRCAAVFLAYTAGQLADDLADGDCTYLEDATRTGPSVQYLLQCLFYAGMCEAGATPATVAAVARELAVGTGIQQVEVRTTTWTKPLAQDVATGLAGRQVAAFLTFLWEGTPLEAQAASVGEPLGVSAHIATDARTRDERYWGLPESDRRSVLEWARNAANAVRASGLQSVLPVLAFIDDALAEAR